MFLSLITLAVALSLSVIAAWYSIAGLAAIFAAAVVPIMIMGGILETAKIVVTLWLHEYWRQCRWLMKAYLVPAVFMLMLITSMGIFGFLSKAHSDQNMVSGDVQAKIALYDEKIKIEKENIDANRKALKQMDEAVDQVMGRSQDEKGADKAVAIRRTQQKERARLLADITESQKKITALSEERAPIAAEVRKVEAEVGPIKYIAALIYEDNPDTNVLEKAVRWVIIILVSVFDPLAIMMLLAATESLKWNREKKYEEDDGPLTDEQIKQVQDLVEDLPTSELTIKTELFPEDNTINCAKCGTALVEAQGIGLFCPNKDCNTEGEQHDTDEELPVAEVPTDRIVQTEEVKEDIVASVPQASDTDDDHLDGMDAETKTAARRWKEENPNSTLKAQHRLLETGKIARLPWLEFPYYLELEPDNAPVINNTNGFGIAFPLGPKKGDTFLRVDRLPSVLYKYNGNNWIEVDKALNNRYAYNEAYIDHLIAKIDSGEYDLDLLSDAEREQIERRLTGQ
jgi:uncharacterized Zn finger protein (UPF0148 family)